MTFHRTTLWLVLASVVVTGLTGCMKRRETITVAPDGGVTVQVKYETDSRDEFTNGDAMPSAEEGWNLQQWTATERNDNTGETKEHYQLEAEKSFAPGARLPDSFASHNAADADLYLQFPTTLQMEKRPDGTYYHFCRIYPVRSEWGRLEAIQKQIFEASADGLDKKKAEELTAADRLNLVKASVLFEVVKMTSFAREAFLETSPQAPQDHWLKLYTALHELAGAVDYTRLADLLATPDNDQRTAAIEAEGKTYEAQAMDRMTATLASACGYSPAQVAEFMDHYQCHKRYHEISEDLGDEHFEITVEMPGEIVAANADKQDGHSAAWEFDGKVLRDRSQELMVTSRVAK
jgi:hypothetical protein